MTSLGAFAPRLSSPPPIDNRLCEPMVARENLKADVIREVQRETQTAFAPLLLLLLLLLFWSDVR